MKVPKKKKLSLQELTAPASLGMLFSDLNPPTSVEDRDDPVSSPRHYVRGGIEVIEVLEKKMSPEAFKGFLMGNVLKYVLRHEYKGGVQDLRKASFYLNRMIDGSHSTDKQVQ